MTTPLSLIVGLGNPGPQYANTRHNAGAWFVEQLAKEFHVDLRVEIKFKAMCGKFHIEDQECWLLIPTSFMNVSGQAIQAFANFYKIKPEAILVAHDELDFAPGIVRLKFAGGHGGHNGLRDIVARLHSHDFNRLRIGIGHPGDRDQVADYVLHSPSKHDHQLIMQALTRVVAITPELIKGDIQKAMRDLHT